MSNKNNSNMDKKRALIVGATGFGGLGLIDILLRHPHLEIAQLVARKDAGKPVSAVFPHLKGFCDIMVESPDEIRYTDIDLAFFSTPDRAGMTLIHEFYKRNIPVIDFSGDFRFNRIEDYRRYARNKGMDEDHTAEELLIESVYGLPERYRKEIKNARIIGNPGCFAISMILGLLPAVEASLISGDRIICDGKTGVSGAGKNSGEGNLYPQRHENMNTYREGRHQHIVEVEDQLRIAGGKKSTLFFIPQVVPINRGILMTMYADPIRDMTTEKLIKIYSDFYRDKSFISITEDSPNTAEVRGSNRCVIRPIIDERSGTIFITSVIDNLMKGQAGNAVQNANILFGFNEDAGLDIPAFYP